MSDIEAVYLDLLREVTARRILEITEIFRDPRSQIGRDASDPEIREAIKKLVETGAARIDAERRLVRETSRTSP